MEGDQEVLEVAEVVVAREVLEVAGVAVAQGLFLLEGDQEVHPYGRDNNITIQYNWKWVVALAITHFLYSYHNEKKDTIWKIK